MNYYTVSEDTWIPAAGDGAGTISCSGTIVTGSGTFFTIQVESGDWITNSGEARQVRAVNSDTDLELYKPFSSDFSGQALSIIKEDNAKNLFLGIKNKSGADITVNGESVPNGASVVKGQQNAPGYRRKFVEPVYVETTGTVLVNKQSITNRRVNATVPPSPISTIYGLQFDGVSNNMAIDFSSEASSLFEIELYNIGQNLRSVNATIQTIGIENSVNVGYAETGLAITGLRTTPALITAPYANKALFSGDIEDISNALINGLNTGLTENLRTPFGILPLYTIFVGSRADNNFPNSGILTRAQMGNLVADDSNNWLGATINGATRVQSTDGGVTWTPA